MDLPLILEKQRTVVGMEELNQIIKVVLTCEYGTILHDINKGIISPLHTKDDISIDASIRQALSSIQGIDIVNIDIDGEVVDITYSYRGELTKFAYIVK